MRVIPLKIGKKSYRICADSSGTIVLKTCRGKKVQPVYVYRKR